MNENICQSCGMKMREGDHGRNADGSQSSDYCKYCFPDGKFGKDETMETTVLTRSCGLYGPRGLS